MPTAFYLSDIVLLLAAIAAAVTAIPQSRGKVVPRWHLLLPGVLATVATIALMSYPHPKDLLDLEMWSTGAVGFLVGAARGQFMGVDSDQSWGLVRLRYGRDALWAAIALACFAAIHFVVEMVSRDVNPYMTSVSLLMTLSGSYLAGRSLVGWIGAGTRTHVDLHD